MPGYCPVCGTELVFAETVLDMWCPTCRDYISNIKQREEDAKRTDGTVIQHEGH